MEDALLDMSQDELTIKETQLGDSPATFSRNLVDRFKIIGHNTQTGSETVNSTDNKLFLFSLIYYIATSCSVFCKVYATNFGRRKSWRI